MTLREAMAAAERAYLVATLAEAGGRVSIAAKVAEINRTHFHNLLTKYKIPRPFPAKVGNWVTETSVRAATSPPRVVKARTFAPTKPHTNHEQT